MENKIKTVEQKTVMFYDDELIAVHADDGQVYVSLRHLCNSIGVARQSQVRRIREQHVLSKGYIGGTIMIPPGKRGGRQKAGLLQIDAVSAYKQALAIVELARNQVLIEARLDDYGERLERIESVLSNTGRAVTPDQASQISQAVKAVAIVLGQQTKRNEFGAVYGEMYRKFRVTSYNLLPAYQFEKVMQWLSNWYRDITDGGRRTILARFIVTSF